MLLVLACGSWTNADLDGDGVTVDQGDCNDADATAYPGATDLFGDHIDSDCDGLDGTDGDGDGVIAAELGGTDCDDTDPAVYPGAEVLCDDLDNDCDGLIEAAGCREHAVLPLAQADLLLQGELAFNYAGRGIAAAGDLDGDGLDDVLIGGTLTDWSGGDAGSIWVLTGSWLSTRPAPSTISLTQSPARIDGQPGDTIGKGDKIQGLGDLDGDGRPEIGFSTPRGNDNTGAVYLFSSQDSGWHSGTHTVGQATTNLIGVDGGAVKELASAGDVNGDGLADLLVSASDDDTHGESAGAVYLLFGGQIPAGDVDITGSPVKAYGSATGEQLGEAIAAGDLNADGLSDIVFSAPGRSTALQEAGVLFSQLGGELSGTLALEDLPTIAGDQEGHGLGNSLDAGDLDSDGYDDILTRDRKGEALWMVSGSATGLPEGTIDDVGEVVLDLTDLPATFNDVRIAGDLDQDGHADITVASDEDQTGGEDGSDCGLPDYSTNTSPGGAGWILYGPHPEARSEPDVRITGAPGQGIRNITAAGDLNGDGWTDLLVSSHRPRCWAGLTGIFFGGPE